MLGWSLEVAFSALQFIVWMTEIRGQSGKDTFISFQQQTCAAIPFCLFTFHSTSLYYLSFQASTFPCVPPVAKRAFLLSSHHGGNRVVIYRTAIRTYLSFCHINLGRSVLPHAPLCHRSQDASFLVYHSRSSLHHQTDWHKNMPTNTLAKHKHSSPLKLFPIVYSPLLLLTHDAFRIPSVHPRTTTRKDTCFCACFSLVGFYIRLVLALHCRLIVSCSVSSCSCSCFCLVFLLCL